MDTKLTLIADKDIVEQAKLYAKLRKTSLSRLIESYLSSLIDTKSAKVEITPLVKSLSGVIDLVNEEESNYTDYLIEKYK
jgi:hypothetical protein